MEITHKFNPEHKGLETERKCDASTIIIFGASGNLTRKKLMPALYKLYVQGFIGNDTKIIGVSRTYNDDNEFREAMKKAIKETETDCKGWDQFSEILDHIKADTNNDESYEDLKKEIINLETNEGCGGNRLFYLATPPESFDTIIDNLGKHDLSRPKDESCWTRIIVEKPFGRNLESAQRLDKKIGRVFREKQIYRIDHYLGKETVQNLLAFRFGNSIFEPIWNRNYIDHIQITAAETIGVEDRAAYYETAGALRDMVPNHLFQLMALIAMEPPVTFEADIVRDEKVQVFHAIEPIKYEEVSKFAARGQYIEGMINNEKVPAYVNEKDVKPDSKTETYTALKLFVQNWRWAGVPIYIRTGKRMAKFVTDITLIFKKTPHMIFRTLAKDVHVSNILSIQIQPDESITLTFNAKIPGAGMQLKPVVMDFDYSSAFGTRAGNAYERLLRDCLTGDQTLYSRRDGIEAAWAVIDYVFDRWENEKNIAVPKYASGTWGPKEADELLLRDGRRWKIL
ncbi:MAG TPA: glucose-6-phosphate dehydrogenase [Ignavibacteria bacterium]|jgi:glucose-6-phosphate 1-dehydrogenase